MSGVRAPRMTHGFTSGSAEALYRSEYRMRKTFRLVHDESIQYHLHTSPMTRGYKAETDLLRFPTHASIWTG